MKSDQASKHYNKMITDAFNLSIELLPICSKLFKIVTQYLLVANLNHTWGLALLNIAVSTLTPEQLHIVCAKIGEWGLLQNYLEKSNEESAIWVLDEVHRLHGDKDTLFGFRMNLVTEPLLKNSYVHLQQREYYKSLELIQSYGK